MNKELPDTIADNISSIGDVEVVDNAPDLVHVFGKWSGTTATTMKRLHAQRYSRCFHISEWIGRCSPSTFPHACPNSISLLRTSRSRTYKEIVTQSIC